MTKFCNGCKIEKSVENFSLNRGHKDGLCSQCKSCCNSKSKKHYIDNIDKYAERNANRDTEKSREAGRKSYQKHKETTLKRIKEYKVKNADLVKQRNRKYYARNKEHILRHIKIWSAFNPEKAGRSAWKKANKEKVASYGINRRAAELQRTTPWARDIMKDYIKLMIRFRDSLTKQTNREQTLEHIIPLQGKLVSGLHIPWNLKFLTMPENSRKNNKFEPTCETFNPPITVNYQYKENKKEEVLNGNK